jgi:hypothetical protein
MLGHISPQLPLIERLVRADHASGGPPAQGIERAKKALFPAVLNLPKAPVF